MCVLCVLSVCGCSERAGNRTDITEMARPHERGENTEGSRARRRRRLLRDHASGERRFGGSIDLGVARLLLFERRRR